MVKTIKLNLEVECGSDAQYHMALQSIKGTLTVLADNLKRQHQRNRIWVTDVSNTVAEDLASGDLRKNGELLKAKIV